PRFPGPVAPGSLLSLSGRLASGVLGLLGGRTGRLLRLARNLACLVGGLTRGPVIAGLCLHRFGRLYHVADDDASVATSAFDLREVNTPLPRLAAGRVRGVDLALAPDLVRVQVGDVLPRLVYAFLHVGVVVHQLLKKRLEGLFAPAGDLIRQPFER